MNKDKWAIKRGGIVRVTSSMIQRLKREASRSPFGRARICLHQDPKGPVQEMVIALDEASYIKPHKHVDREESLSVIQGSLCLVTFDAKGEIKEKIIMGGRRSPGVHLCKIRKNILHTMLPLSKFVVYHELIQGPCCNGKGSTIASWAPHEKDPGGIQSLWARIL